MNKRIRLKLKKRQGYRTYARYYANCIDTGKWEWVYSGSDEVGIYVTHCDWPLVYDDSEEILSWLCERPLPEMETA